MNHLLVTHSVRWGIVELGLPAQAAETRFPVRNLTESSILWFASLTFFTVVADGIGFMGVLLQGQGWAISWRLDEAKHRII